MDDILQVQWYFLNSSAKKLLAHGQLDCDCKVAQNISEPISESLLTMLCIAKAVKH
jgi:hypothetical protein